MQPREWLGTGGVPPCQLREVDAGEIDVVEIAVVELMQLVQRPVVADPLACPEDELAEEALFRIALVGDKRRKESEGEVQHGKVLSNGQRHSLPLVRVGMDVEEAAGAVRRSSCRRGRSGVSPPAPPGRGPGG